MLDFLARHPDALVLHLGCGLDGRVFRLDPPPSVLWFDLDQPGVIELRRRLYSDTGQYRMIGSSVTDPQWLDDVPGGRPTLVVAEGLLMYLPEQDVRELLDRFTDRFEYGELHFDTISPLGPPLSKVFTNSIVKWGIHNARDMRRGIPRCASSSARPRWPATRRSSRLRCAGFTGCSTRCPSEPTTC